MNKNIKAFVSIASIALLLSACRSAGRNTTSEVPITTSGNSTTSVVPTTVSSTVSSVTSEDPTTISITSESSSAESTASFESSATSSSVESSTSENISSSYTTSLPPDVDDYYASISDSLTGEALLGALRSLNKTKRKSTVGYSAMGTSPAGQFKYTDYDPSTVKYDENGQPYGTKIISFYSGNPTSNFNREHVWPKSHGGNLVESDIHMPRPTIASENGSRGNSFYVEGKCDQASGWDPAMESFGKEDYRGDSARIIFYCCIASDKLSLIEAESHTTSNSNRDNLMGKLSDMLSWNLRYAVQDREQRRNDGAEYLQGNRNPFIDHPEYACRIWGTANDKARQVCGM